MFIPKYNFKYIQRYNIDVKYTGSVMKVGNSRVLVLPKPLCDIYEIERGNTFDILATEEGLFIPARPRELSSIKEVIEQSMKTWVEKNAKGKKKG